MKSKFGQTIRRGPYNLYTHASFLARQRLQMGCSPPHLTLRRRHGSHEKALFLVARAELVVVVVVVVLVLFPLPLFPDPFEVALDADAILSHCPECKVFFFGQGEASARWMIGGEGRGGVYAASSKQEEGGGAVQEASRRASSHYGVVGVGSDEILPRSGRGEEIR